MLRSAVSSTDSALSSVRRLLAAASLDALLVPSTDAHQSEYVAECDKRRAFLSGFTGSAGTAVVSADEALLWTDGRYFDQAVAELGNGWSLMRDGLQETPTIQQYLGGKKVGVHDAVISVADVRKFRQQQNIQLEVMRENLVDQIWAEQRPKRPANPVLVHPLEFAGEDAGAKMKRLREKMEEQNAEVLVVCALDEVAWLFNLRGADVKFNPVFFAYGVITSEQACLFINPQQLSEEVQSYLKELNVNVSDYSEISEYLKSMKVDQDRKVWIDPSQTNMAIFDSLDGKEILEAPSAVQALKSIKNSVEIQGFRNAHIRDAVAKIQFLCWIENEVRKGNESLNEFNAAKKLGEFRSKQDHFMGLSFDTITGCGPNGAIIHYSADAESCRRITADDMLLIDSGGQYRDGTTDVTRTIHFGTPNAFEKECFTRVLKGHIALDMAIFPYGTTGPSLDVLARMHLWRAGLNYRHGTGHGVGSFLNVHEGPQGISSTLKSELVMKTVLVPGMTVTNEPGYYESGKFGIRIENVLVVKEIDTPYKFGDKPYLAFENVTMIPIQKKLINIDLLSEEEIAWLNDYHRECFDKVSPFLTGEALEWMRISCEPL